MVGAESPPGEPADGLFADFLPFHLGTMLHAFRAAGLEAGSRRGLERRRVYPTTAVKCARPGHGPERATVEACSHLLEHEIDLFPEARVIVLLGGVAIAAFNAVARRRTGRRLIPSWPAWKARAGEYRCEGKRVFASCLSAGRSCLIERAKREMVAADLRAAPALLGD